MVTEAGKPVCLLHGTRFSTMQRGAKAQATAEAQEPAFRALSARQWDDIVDEVTREVVKRAREAAMAMAGASAAPAPPTTLPSSSSQPPSQPQAKRPAPNAPTASRPTRPQHLWQTSTASAATATAPAEARPSDKLATQDFACPECGERDAEYVRVRTSDGLGSKADTWGSSDRPDVVMRLTCRVCGHVWTREEG